MEKILKGFSTFVLLLDLSLKGQMYTFSLNQNVKGGKLANIYTFEGRGKSLEYFGIHSIKCNKSAFNTLEIIYTYTSSRWKYTKHTRTTVYCFSPIIPEP